MIRQIQPQAKVRNMSKFLIVFSLGLISFQSVEDAASLTVKFLKTFLQKAEFDTNASYQKHRASTDGIQKEINVYFKIKIGIRLLYKNFLLKSNSNVDLNSSSYICER